MTYKMALLSAVAVLSSFGSQALAQGNPVREAYFGETHVHTSYSPDAWVFGNRLTDPGDAYKYFKGQPIKHPLGYDIKIDTPLDFAGVTDHSEYAGVVKLANDPNSPISKLPAAAPLIPKSNSQEEIQKVFLQVLKLVAGDKVPALLNPEVIAAAWEKNVEFANKANEPGKFTAFCSYEWTSAPNNMNLHRNIFFKDCAHVPARPFSAIDSTIPSDLWKWMDGQRSAGNDLLAISHNANLSDGRMYPTEIDLDGRPIDKAYAEDRMRNEPLVELKQIKGVSETHPLLSPNDEFANFELWAYLLGDPEGRIPHVMGSYARQALKDGLTLEDTKGFNPYKFGFGAASDSHDTGVAYRQDNFFGGHGALDGTIEKRMSGTLFTGVDTRRETTGGLTGVWAEENTRESIFNAMKRKETFAVSGPHIKVRFFGGWNYSDTETADQRREFWKNAPDWVKNRDWVTVAYAQGVPMGADMMPRPAGDKAPSFAVWAVKDPTSGNLDRIQIIKGWTKSGQSFEKVFDVAWAGDREPDKWTGVVPPVGSTVDIEKGTYTNSIGAVELKTVWTDPEFDSSAPAFYYARVLEIPTPRWTTIQAAQLGIAPPDVVASAIQERAWSSPIWYTAPAELQKLAKTSPTINDLEKQGAVPLNDAQLRALIVGKSLWLQNNVTGTKFKITYSALGTANATQTLTPIDPAYSTSKFAPNQGQIQINHVGRNTVQASAVGNAAAASYLGTTSPYYIDNGKIVTELAGTAIEITAYKLGDKYYGARSNEFGYANYEIIPDVKELNPLEPGWHELR
jgi:hypothetical protein